MNISQTIMIVAGESSGDLHGSHVARSLKDIDPSLTLLGAGGHIHTNSCA